MNKIEQSKTEILRAFAKRVPNAQSMAIDYGRDTLTVWFDGIHSKEYKASTILDALVQGALKQGFEVVWKG